MCQLPLYIYLIPNETLVTKLEPKPKSTSESGGPLRSLVPSMRAYEKMVNNRLPRFWDCWTQTLVYNLLKKFSFILATEQSMHKTATAVDILWKMCTTGDANREVAIHDFLDETNEPFIDFLIACPLGVSAVCPTFRNQ